VAILGDAYWAGSAPLSHAGPGEIAAAYLNDGSRLLRQLRGAFALVIIVDQVQRREVLIATDRLGIEAMYYGQGAEHFAFGSRADGVANLVGARALDAQGLFDYLYFHMIPAPRTAFTGIHRLLPGTCALWRDGKLTLEQYWEPTFVEDGPFSFRDAKEAFLEALEAGITRTKSDATALGCFLSGGTDSSTVSGMLGRVAGGAPVRTFSIGFDAQGYDEISYARLAARHFATSHHEYYVTPGDVADAVASIASAHDQPLGNASVVPAYYCARLAREHGIERMLAGDGGDELFGGNERYATQALFSYYERVPTWFRDLFEPTLAPLPNRGVLRRAQGYVRQAKVPLPDRLQTYNLLARLGTDTVLDPAFAEQIDTQEPLRLLRESYDGARADSQINRLLALDLRFTLADSDLPKVNRACELAGIEVAYPLLNEAVVEFSLRLPPDQKLKGRRLRYFFKHALRDFLPPKVIAKKKHGFGLPFGVWLRSNQNLRQLAGDSLVGLRKRRIVQVDLLDQLMSAKLTEHAGYYGTMVWILMTLELWLGRIEESR
jgi:asparagine synthase (glutamine-hydrolysing)